MEKQTFKRINKTFTVDLDKSPSEMWNEVVDAYKEPLKWVQDNFHTLIPYPGIGIVCDLMESSAKKGHVM
jgi:hypothetical protein